MQNINPGAIEQLYLITYKVYTALVGQQSVVWTDSGLLVIGKTYVIPSVSGDDDFTNVGYVDGQPFVATGTTPTKWTNGTIVENNTDSSLDVDIVGANTIGDIVWRRDYAGYYFGTLPGAFTIGKTICPPQGVTGNSANVWQTLRAGGSVAGSFSFYSNEDGDTIGLDVRQNTNDPSDLNSVIDSSGKLWLEIRVYP